MTPANTNWTSGGLRRAGTIVKAPLELRKEKEKGKQGSGNLLPQEVCMLASPRPSESLNLSNSFEGPGWCP